MGALRGRGADFARALARYLLKPGAEGERDAAGHDQHGAGVVLDQVEGGGAERDLALTGLGARADHEQVGVVAPDGGDDAPLPSASRERLRGALSAGVGGILGDGDPLHELAARRSARPAEAIAIAKRPPSSRRWAELPTVTWRGAVWESEQNTIASAPSRSASARSPSGVERSATT